MSIDGKIIKIYDKNIQNCNNKICRIKIYLRSNVSEINFNNLITPRNFYRFIFSKRRIEKKKIALANYSLNVTQISVKHFHFELSPRIPNQISSFNYLRTNFEHSILLLIQTIDPPRKISTSESKPNSKPTRNINIPTRYSIRR